MTSKERLQEYINKDEIYLNFQKGNKISSDFDMFCIQHCEDIRTILAQYETLKSKFEAVLEENKKANDIIDNNLELIDHIDEKLKKCRKKKQQVEDKCSRYKWTIDKLIDYLLDELWKNFKDRATYLKIKSEIEKILEGDIDEQNY